MPPFECKNTSIVVEMHGNWCVSAPRVFFKRNFEERTPYNRFALKCCYSRTLVSLLYCAWIGRGTFISTGAWKKCWFSYIESNNITLLLYIWKSTFFSAPVFISIIRKTQTNGRKPNVQPPKVMWLLLS